MAQTGFTPIQLYFSSTTTNAPLAANLASGELAINITDGKLFYKDNANAVQVIAWKVTPTTAGGTGLTSYTAGDMVYYASGTVFSKLGIGAADYVMTSSGTAPQWSQFVKAVAGGTGQTSYAVGDLLYANTTTTLAKLADVATGNALISGGVNTAPSWGKIGLTTHVSGTLPIANGGTAQTSFTAGQIHFGSFSTSSNLFWDNTNARLGIGTSSPSNINDLQVSGSFSARARNNGAGVGEYAGWVFQTANTFSGTSEAYVRVVSESGGNSTAGLALGVNAAGGGASYTAAYVEGAGHFRPGADNAYSCGTASFRWSVIYSATALINTSDGTTKTVIGSIDDAEKRVAQRIKSGIKKFKFNDSIAVKGDAARIHWGVIAQDVKAAFEAEGLDAEKYAMFCSDTWFEKDGQKVLSDSITDNVCPEGATEVTRLGVRYEELLTFIIASM